ncbi:hypothetical protein [Thermosphaera sp.]|uniref:Uncharacterized protein n=1 Tax=Thermosphaera aggregans TaxID=54254 RepID=A0A7C2BKS0_9CREN
MYMLILGLTAVFSTVLWYKNLEKDDLLYKNLALISWGATLMFLIDKAYASIVEGEGFISVSPESIALGILLLFVVLTIWVATIIWKDPKKALRAK